jgi:hypothetical protein
VRLDGAGGGEHGVGKGVQGEGVGEGDGRGGGEQIVEGGRGGVEGFDSTGED